MSQTRPQVGDKVVKGNTGAGNIIPAGTRGVVTCVDLRDHSVWVRWDYEHGHKYYYPAYWWGESIVPIAEEGDHVADLLQAFQ